VFLIILNLLIYLFILFSMAFEKKKLNSAFLFVLSFTVALLCVGLPYH
jgi:hypothetical protein